MPRCTEVCRRGRYACTHVTPPRARLELSARTRTLPCAPGWLGGSLAAILLPTRHNPFSDSLLSLARFAGPGPLATKSPERTAHAEERGGSAPPRSDGAQTPLSERGCKRPGSYR